VYSRDSQFAAAAAAQQSRLDSVMYNLVNDKILQLCWNRLEGQTQSLVLVLPSHRHHLLRTRHVASGGRHLPVVKLIQVQSHREMIIREGL
jgi:hypothetical protein